MLCSCKNMSDLASMMGPFIIQFAYHWTCFLLQNFIFPGPCQLVPDQLSHFKITNPEFSGLLMVKCGHGLNLFPSLSIELKPYKFNSSRTENVYK